MPSIIRLVQQTLGNDRSPFKKKRKTPKLLLCFVGALQDYGASHHLFKKWLCVMAACLPVLDRRVIIVFVYWCFEAEWLPIFGVSSFKNENNTRELFISWSYSEQSVTGLWEGFEVENVPFLNFLLLWCCIWWVAFFRWVFQGAFPVWQKITSFLIILYVLTSVTLTS